MSDSIDQKVGFWGHVGKGFASTAGLFIKLAKWASDHPEVINAVEQVAQIALAAKKGSN